MCTQQSAVQAGGSGPNLQPRVQGGVVHRRCPTERSECNSTPLGLDDLNDARAAGLARIGYRAFLPTRVSMVMQLVLELVGTPGEEPERITV